MSDFSIPGVSSGKYNTEKIIEGLMKAERIPLEKLEQKKEEDFSRKSVWRSLNRQIGKLRENAKALYGFQNPFQNKLAVSSDEEVLTASASREAIKETREVEVVKTASSDKFASKQLDKNFKIAPGKYLFLVGDKRVGFNYGGGSVKDFVKTLSEKGKGVIKAYLIDNKKESGVLVIESLLTGEKNRLIFEEKAADLALDSGLVKKKVSSLREFSDPSLIVPWTKKLENTKYEFSDSILKLHPGNEVGIKVDPAAANLDTVLEMTIKLKMLPEVPIEENAVLTGPELPSGGVLEYEGVGLVNNPFDVPLPDVKKPAPPPPVTDMKVLFFSVNNNIVQGPELKDIETEQKIRIPLSGLGGALDKIYFRNRSTYRDAEISDIKIFDPDERGDFVPLNPVSSASDSLIKIDGIEVKRDGNSIDDVIPGVTLNLKQRGSRPVSVNITSDNESIKNSIIGFVGSYNALMTELQILTRYDDSVIDEIEYFTDDERKEAEEKLGKFQGDLTLMQMRTKIQNIMTESYPVENQAFALLDQIGISTHSANVQGASDVSRRRGYMEIDEEKLESAIESHSEEIEDLFGYDADNDYVIDTGVAYTMDSYAKGYNESGGVIPLKIETLERSIGDADKKIEDYKQKLARTEQKLKYKYGMMEGALNEMEKTSESLNNFSIQNRDK